MEGLRKDMRTRRSSAWFELWRHDLRETRGTWFPLVDPNDKHFTPEGS
ncbi:hypothetical protein [Streptomyces sp. NPDC059861]